MADLILALDQGTSSTKALLVDGTGAVVGSASVPVGIAYPQPGWVEQDAGEILASVLEAATRCLDGAGAGAGRLAGIALSTQRESAVLWETATGRAVGPLLGWQDRRSADICAALRDHEPEIRRRSGLPLDPMFSAAKIKWLLDIHEPSRERAAAGELTTGTVDAWLVHRLTGQRRTEAGNASRTQLLDTRLGTWSPELLALFDVPAAVLPSVVASTEPAVVTGGVLDGAVVRAVLGDSHAALHAHHSLAGSGAKVTYGTGSSVMRLLDKPDDADDTVCLTVAWSADGLQHAAEGNIRSSGATVNWLATLLGSTPEAVAAAAASAESSGVHLVPAFGGLAAPWWDDDATALISGLTLGSGPAQLARAAVESIAHQVDDVVFFMDGGGGPAIEQLLADGGASSNDVLMQIQADLSGLPVLRARESNLSALGAAHLAGAAAGLWPDSGPAAGLSYDRFDPAVDPARAAELRQGWRAALALARSAHD